MLIEGAVREAINLLELVFRSRVMPLWSRPAWTSAQPGAGRRTVGGSAWRKQLAFQRGLVHARGRQGIGRAR